MTTATLGVPQNRHLAQVDRDRFGHVPLFGSDPGKRAGRINQGNERQTELPRPGASPEVPCDSLPDRRSRSCA